MKQYSKVGQFFLHLIMILFSLMVLYPVLNVIAVSISDNSAVMRGEVTIFPKGFTMRAYEYMIHYNLLGSGYKNTLFIVIVGTSINLLMTMMTAYALARRSLIGRKFFMLMITFTMMFTGGLIPNFILIRNLHLMDTLWSLILPGSISAYNMIIMKNFFESIPEELKEAARIDGLSEMGILFKIVVPLSMASIATIGLFYAVGHWNSYFNATIYLNSRKNWPLQVVLRDLIQKANTNGIDAEMTTDYSTAIPLESLKMAVVIATTGPIILVYPFIQKYFVKGVMIGSLKG